MSVRIRLAWGPAGAQALATSVDLAVVVDVLSFTTACTVAVDRGITVLPYRWRDATAAAYARERDAALAVDRAAAGPGDLSLSPATIRSCPRPPARLVLPSPNGSTICHHLAASGTRCVAACLRNVSAVVAWLAGPAAAAGSVAVIAAGERWPDGSLRRAAEDAWGAGAVIAGLVAGGWSGRCPDARAAAASYESVRGREREALFACPSGRELVAAGFPDDVAVAADVDACAAVPLLRDGAFQGRRG